jgi:hypothetical protein
VIVISGGIFEGREDVFWGGARAGGFEGANGFAGTHLEGFDWVVDCVEVVDGRVGVAPDGWRKDVLRGRSRGWDGGLLIGRG